MQELTPLDVVASRLPALPDSVLKNLWTPFVPDKFAPTEFLKDVPPPYGPKPRKYLDRKNAHKFDDRIAFVGGLEGIDVSAEDDTGTAEKDEPHRYYIDGSCRNIISVTTFLKSFFEPFNAIRQSESTFKSKTFANTKHRPTYKYYGCNSPEDIRAVWKKGAQAGTKMHANLECHFNGEPYNVCADNQMPIQQFYDLFADTEWATWEPFRTEWSVFDPEILLAGQIDLVGMLNRDRSEIVIIDWKRCENIMDCSFARLTGKSGTERCTGVGPCAELENCNFVHYSLQLNCYAYILQKVYGFKTVKMFILQFHPKNKENRANVYKAPNLFPIVEQMMACRKIALRKNGVIC